MPMFTFEHQSPDRLSQFAESLANYHYSPLKRQARHDCRHDNIRPAALRAGVAAAFCHLHADDDASHLPHVPANASCESVDWQGRGGEEDER